MEPIRVLLVEDSETDAIVITAHLRSSGLFKISHVPSLYAACESLQHNHTDVVILDLNLPDSAGLATYESLHLRFPAAPVVILSGQEDQQLAVAAVAKGAQDYVPKESADKPLLVRSLRYAIERQARLLAERRNLLIESDLEVARRIQQRMLPVEPPQIPGYDIAAVCRPTAACGGDFFDFIQRADGTWDVLVADVSSHGFGPALIMVGTRRILRTCSAFHDDLGKILTIASEAVAEDTFGEHFVTVFYARVQPRERVFTYSAAGHPVWVVTARGDVISLDCDGFPLGLVPETQYCNIDSRQLHPGDILFMPTDGSYEAINSAGEIFGQQQVLDLVVQSREQPAAVIRDRLLAAVTTFCEPEVPQDDVTLVLIKVCE
ncbi:PP2C family protein-serine/threonine phosphatase [Roseimaritima ulvae]|uniref:PP2C family protein-serine/threonine phosphatase n=1 Tax=Roseimaritima ulvae TaxID=980254 RepID=UPI000832F2FA|nr:SpoIIE family protein phosphatase [Roseimaritima ulvae]